MPLADNLSIILNEAKEAIANARDMQALEAVRVAYLGKSGVILEKMKLLGSLPPEERRQFGAAVNAVKEEVGTLLVNARSILEKAGLEAKLRQESVDVTLPIRPENKGSVHPVSKVIEEVTDILGAMGFTVAEGPEIEDDWHNFEALNFPPNHPAREMQDTFFLKQTDDGEPLVLRTHTSSVQIRTMETGNPPFRFIATGRTYRCDSDMTHTPMFHQVEGLFIDKNVNMGHLKGCLKQFVDQFFGVSDVPVRFRPSFFPFTEPSAEMDIGCVREGGEIKIGTGKDWLEILGCGMVHPNVLKNVGIDPQQWQGFAFGMGIERLAMLKYGIPDLRTFFESDIRWLNHYGFTP